VARWSDGGMIFALANPTPEVHPDVAHRHAAIVATGRSDFPNQINNVLAFPGIFRGRSTAAPDRSPRR
jgi:malate dehydrogenase (oxaloacetate-decarboxylating)